MRRLSTRWQMNALLASLLFIGVVQVNCLFEPPSSRVVAVGLHLSVLVAAGLSGLLGIGILGRHFSTRELQADLEARLSAASGDMTELVERRFADWGLSRTEREVALLVIKGFSNGEIAALRGTKLATTKCQISAIFRKSGLSSRQQLASMLLEDVVDRMTEDRASGAAAGALAT